jgi:hypothetical protein
MKLIAARVAVFTGICGGVIVAAAHAASARLATNHCEPVVLNAR